MAVLLTRRAVVRAAMETTYNTPATLTNNDGVLVAEPNYVVEPNVLERNFTRDSLSPQAHIVGRKLSKMEFQTELRSNGAAQSGVEADAPILARLFRACGYDQIGHADPWALGVYDVDAHQNQVTWTVDVTGSTNTDVIAYYIEVTTGGASGVAQITVTSDTAGEGLAAAAITTARRSCSAREGSRSCRSSPATS